MGDIIVLLIIVAIVGTVLAYIVKCKKKGHACIGCVNSAKCGGASKCSGTCQTTNSKE